LDNLNIAKIDAMPHILENHRLQLTEQQVHPSFMNEVDLICVLIDLIDNLPVVEKLHCQKWHD
jgi:hypothetical protein